MRIATGRRRPWEKAGAGDLKDGDPKSRPTNHSNLRTLGAAWSFHRSVAGWVGRGRQRGISLTLAAHHRQGLGSLPMQKNPFFNNFVRARYLQGEKCFQRNSSPAARYRPPATGRLTAPGEQTNACQPIAVYGPVYEQNWLQVREILKPPAVGSIYPPPGIFPEDTR